MSLVFVSAARGTWEPMLLQAALKFFGCEPYRMAGVADVSGSIDEERMGNPADVVQILHGTCFFERSPENVVSCESVLDEVFASSLCALVKAHDEQDNAAIRVGQLQRMKGRERLRARFAPRRPEIQDDDAAAKPRKRYIVAIKIG